MADEVMSLLSHPALGTELRNRAFAELRALTWDKAAESCAHLYQQCLS